MIATGKEITHWDWSTQPEIKDEPKWPPILVPGGAHITFTVKEGKRPPIPRPPTPPLIQASERVPGAPVLSLELSCSPIMTLTGSLDVHIRVIYHGVSNSDNTAISKEAQPITFHTHAFDPVDGEFRVYRRRCLDQSRPETEEEWETFEGDDYCQFGIWDNHDKLINVSENPKGRFPTLFPGESWSDFWTMPADGDVLPHDLKPGERLRYQFKGNTLDWWDWGTAAALSRSLAREWNLFWTPRIMEVGRRWLYRRQMLWSGRLLMNEGFLSVFWPFEFSFYRVALALFATAVFQLGVWNEITQQVRGQPSKMGRERVFALDCIHIRSMSLGKEFQ
ncbi:hypothetical protein DTO169C6_4029 [Paecilomyces variotii]|nr:hypothetical protein DTO169C6_4029 [Paecilomyces variotii]KAJ9380205.1 hypothetical protein DTO063F5_6780 [Paecilomyces variotii]